LILCLDNDAPGRNATARLCASPLFRDFLNSTCVEVFVASLPPNVDDPGAFCTSGGDAARFRAEVLETARPYAEWYLRHVVAELDPLAAEGQRGLRAVLGRAAHFLMERGLQDMAATAAEAAAARLMAARNLTEVEVGGGAALRIQIETHILDAVARMEGEDEAGRRRTRATLLPHQGRKGVRKESTETGADAAGEDDTRLSHRSAREGNPPRPALRWREEEPPPYLPQFACPSDRDWLEMGTTRGDRHLVLGLERGRGPQKEIVYFQESTAGLVLASPAGRDVSRQKVAAEEQLLRALVCHPAARNALLVPGGAAADVVVWSAPEREWLYRVLKGETTDNGTEDVLPPELREGGTAKQLQEHLRERLDVPAGAFAAVPDPEEEGEALRCDHRAAREKGSTVDVDREGKVADDADAVEWEGFLPGLEKYGKPDTRAPEDHRAAAAGAREAPRGSLDVVFEDRAPEALHGASVLQDGDARAQLTVQEALATILKCMETLRRDHLLAMWRETEAELSRRPVAEDAGGDGDAVSADVMEAADSEVDAFPDLPVPQKLSPAAMATHELQALVPRIQAQAAAATASVRRQEDSHRRVRGRILEHATQGKGVSEFSSTAVEREELYDMMDNFLDNLEEDGDVGLHHDDDALYVFGTDAEAGGDVHPAYGQARREIVFDPQKRPTRSLDNSGLTELIKQHADNLPYIEDSETQPDGDLKQDQDQAAALPDLDPAVTYLLRFDGGSRGNPSPVAGAGYILLAPDGPEVAAGYAYLGTNGTARTNNEAEYLALLGGLELCARLGVRKLMVQGDSELVVRQVTGEYKCKSRRLQPLHEKVIGLMREDGGTFELCLIEHILREENGRADALANLAMDTMDTWSSR